MTIRDQIVAARARLMVAGIAPDEAARDAALLARHVLGWGAAALVARDREPLPDGFAASFATLVDRRADREPMAYIRETQEFWGRPFEVSAGVFIPRPETELIVEETLNRVSRGASVDTVCDVGTGSGCVALTLALALPRSHITATDVSPTALQMARTNANRFGLSGRIDFRLGEYLADASGPFDVIVSNPPYIAEREHASLPLEVRDFEPPGALLAGPDGLRHIRELVRLAPTTLSEGGLLIFEMGHDQSARVGALVSGAGGLRLLHIRPDLQGFARVAVVQRRPRPPK